MKKNKSKLYVKQGTVAVIGIPSDVNSSFMRGAAQAPAIIRQAFNSPSSNQCAEHGIDLSSESRFKDLGDLSLNSNRDIINEIELRISNFLDRNMHLISLGGDHFITYPIIKAFSKKYPNLTLILLDAHPDLYDEYEGNRYSHACPFARIMEGELVKRLIQIGVRTLNPHQEEQAQRFGVEIMEMKNLNKDMTFDIDTPIYLSVDMDVLDPAFAPGVSHQEPGGLSTRELITIINELPPTIVGADIVEYNPKRDVSGITAMTAAKLLKEVASRMIQSDHTI
jgi:agmatinase